MTMKFKPEAREKFVKEWNARCNHNYRIDDLHEVNIFLKQDIERTMRERGCCDITLSKYQSIHGGVWSFKMNHESFDFDPPISLSIIEHNKMQEEFKKQK